MTRIEFLDHIPPYELMPHSAWEMGYLRKEELVKGSQVIGQVLDDGVPLAVYGLVTRVLVGPVWFWSFMTSAVAVAPLRALRAFHSVVDTLPPDCYTAVLCGNAAANKFAKHFGFEWVDGGATLGDRVYNIYRRA